MATTRRHANNERIHPMRLVDFGLLVFWQALIDRHDVELDIHRSVNYCDSDWDDTRARIDHGDDADSFRPKFFEIEPPWHFGITGNGFVGSLFTPDVYSFCIVGWIRIQDRGTDDKYAHAI